MSEELKETKKDGDGGRVCNKCKEFKLFEELVRNKTSKFGHKLICKICDSGCSRTYRIENAEAVSIRVKKYSQTERGRQRRNEATRKSVKKLVEASRARSAVRYALKTGKLVRPDQCVRCGIKAKRIEGHHEDYAKKLDVLWLCNTCHHIAHNRSIRLDPLESQKKEGYDRGA